MKKITVLLIIIISGLFFFAACDMVDPPYIENHQGGDTGQFVKKVLLEDYTGHNCPNCPAAAVTAGQLKGIYGDQLVVMAVHAGFFAIPDPSNPPFSNDFRTPAGNTWNDYFKIKFNPNGLVNRISDNAGVYFIPPGNWGSTVAAELQKNADARITIHSDFNTVTRLFSTGVITEFLVTQEKTHNVIVCITQDSIIGGQKFPTSIVEDYVFMDVLRGSLNGDWGEDVTGGQDIVVGEKYEKTYSIVFKPEWIAKNCHVVAFVYNTETKSVLQVEEKNVIE